MEVEEFFVTLLKCLLVGVSGGALLLGEDTLVVWCLLLAILLSLEGPKGEK